MRNEKRREMEKANERLLEKSETDPLTRLANRFRLNDYLERAFERTRDDHRAFAVEILDIDYFKEYNDNYGHQAGDARIVAIADELRKMQSHDTFCARYGGDEFIIIYEYKTEDEVFPWRTVCGSVFLTGGSSMCARRRFWLSQSRRESVLTWLRRKPELGFPACGGYDALRGEKRSRNNISLGHLDAKEARYGEERKLL